MCLPRVFIGILTANDQDFVIAKSLEYNLTFCRRFAVQTTGKNEGLLHAFFIAKNLRK